MEPGLDFARFEALTFDCYDGRLGEVAGLTTSTSERDASQRRVMYLPLMNGPEKLKDENSTTPFYFHLRKLAGY